MATALGAFGGIGQGISQGMQQNRKLTAEDQEAQLRQLQLEQAQADAETQRKIRAAGAGTDEAIAGIKKRASAGSAGLKSQDATARSQDASGQDSMNRAVNDTSSLSPSTSAIINSGDGSTPSVGGISFDALKGQSAPAAPAGGAVDLSNSPGIRPLPASAGLAGSGAPAISDDSAQMLGMKQILLKQASAAQAGGNVQLAQTFMKAANDNELQNYERSWKQAMGVLASGNDQAAATAIAQLYNLGFPDGKYADVKPLGNGQFKVVQYDEQSGKMIDGAVIDRNKMMDLGMNTLNPAERVKIWVEQLHDDRSLRVADAAARRAEAIEGSRHQDRLAHDESMFRRTQLATESAERRSDARNATTLEAVDRRIAGKGDPNAKADAKKEADDKKALDKSMAQARALVTGNKDISPADKPAVQKLVDQYVQNGSTPGDAMMQATQEHKGKKSDAEAAFNTHYQKDIHAKGSFYTSKESDLEKHGDPAIVKAAKAMTPSGALTLPNYRQAYIDARMKGSPAAQETPAAPAAPAAPAGKFVEGKTYVDGSGNKAVYKNGQFVPTK